MATNEEDYDLDGTGFDDGDLDFDNISMDAEEQTESRDPITQLKSNFYRGAVTKVADRRELEKHVREAVPKGYSAAYDEGAKQLAQLNKAKRDLLSPIRKELPEFKRNLNKLSPMVKRIVGDRYGNKFDELTKGKAKGSDVNPDQAEMQAGLSNVFGAWRESQLADREQDIADNLMSAKTDEDRFKLNYTTLNNISNSLRRQVGFQDNVLLGLHEKSLELDFKKYHILRNLLKVTTEGYNTSITELKAITKNTGLPDIIKRQNSENFKQLFLDEWQGRTTANIVDFGKDYLGTMAANLQKKAQETGQAIADGMSGLGDIAGSVADADAMQQEMGGGDNASAGERIISTGGQFAGGMVANKILKFLGTGAKKYLDKNPDALRGDKYLQYVMANKEQLLDNYISERSDAAGTKGLLFGFLDSIRPTIGADRESITQTLAEKATQEAQWDRISRETLVKVIPEWLSKIHLELKKISTGDMNAEQETFDIYSESFVTKSKAMSNLQSRLISDDSIKDVRGDVDKVIGALFASNEKLKDKLSKDQLAILEDAIIRSANNDVGTDLDKFSSSSKYTALPGVEAEDAEAIAGILSQVLNNGEGGSTKYSIRDFSDGGGEANRRLSMLSAFKGLKNVNPETQSVFNLLNATGQSGLLEGLGYGERDATGKLNLNFKNLYDRKLGRYNGNQSPLGGSGGSPLNLMGMRNELDSTRESVESQMATVSLGSEEFDKLNDQLSKLDRATNSIEELMIERMSAPTEVSLSESSLNDIREITKSMRGGDEPIRNNTTQGNAEEDAVVSQLATANETLADVRGVLMELFAANQANHDEMMGRSSMGSFVGDLGTKLSGFIKSPFKLLVGGFNKGRDFAKRNLNRIKSIGRNVIGAPIKFAKGVFGELKAQILTPDDIFVVGKTKAVLLGKEIKGGDYFNRDVDGSVDNNRIKSIDDIHGEVINGETGNVAISLDDYRLGLETRNPGFAKKLGGVAAKLALMPVKLLGGAGKLGLKGLSFIKDKLKAGHQYISGKINQAKTLYDSTGKLLISKEDIEAGMFYIMKDGKRVTVQTLKDITDTVYSYKDGEPVITLDQINEGLRDKLGKVIKLKTLTSSTFEKLGKAAKLAGKVVMSPIKMIGKTAKSLMKIFEGKLVSSLLIHVPDNVVFKANTVYLFADSIVRGGKRKGPRGDSDGDGLRDGGWKETVRDREAEAGKKEDEQPRKGKKDDTSGSGTIVKTLMALLGPIVGMLGSLTGANVLGKIAGIGETIAEGKILKGVTDMFRGGTPTTTTTGGPGRVGRMLTGAKNLAVAGFNKLGGGRAVAATAATVARVGTTRLVAGGAMATATALGLTVVAPLVGIALTAWTAYELGSALWGYFDRRSDIKKLEYLRLMQYGYYVGDDGKAEDRKIALRYFENEMLGRMEKTDSGVVGIDGSTEELWDDYCGDFDSGYGDEAARTQWVGWFEQRFKPVFFKWINVVGKLNTRDDASYSLTNLDSKLESKDYKELTTGVMDYSGLSYDPLEISASCFTSVGIQAKRKQVQSFIDTAILKATKGKVMGETKAPEEVKKAGFVSSYNKQRIPNIENVTNRNASLSRKEKRDGDTKTTVNITQLTTKHAEFDLRRRIVLDTLDGDLKTKLQLLPLVDATLQSLIMGNTGLVGPLKRRFESLVVVEDTGKSGGGIVDWLTNTLIPLIRELMETVGTTEGYFNQIITEDFNKVQRIINNYGKDNTFFKLSDGKVLSPTNLDNLKAELKANTLGINVSAATKPNGNNASKNKSTLFGSFGSVGLSAPTYHYGSLSGNVNLNKGGTNGKDLGNRVEIKPLSLSNKTSGGQAAPHKVTDKVEERISKYNDYIYAASQAKGVDEYLIRSVIRQESAGDPNAKSPVGAMGLMQLMPATAKELGVTNRADPQQSIMGGTEYIRRQLKRFDGVPELALAAYNAGGGNVNKARRLAGSNDPEAVLNALPQVTGRHSKETQQYVVKITNDYRKRLGIKQASNYNAKGNSVSLTKISSKVPEAVKASQSVDDKSLVSTTPSSQQTSTTSPTKPMTTLQRLNKASAEHDRGVEVVKAQQVDAQRKKQVASKQAEDMNLRGDSLASINYDQLIELRTLNSQVAALAESITGNRVTPTSTDTIQSASTDTSEAKAQSGKKFQRRTLEALPTISMDRKIS